MSLYDDFDGMKGKNTEKVADWSSGIKLLQSQLKLKKAATTQPKRDSIRKATQILPPVIDLKSKRDDDDIYSVHAPSLNQSFKQSAYAPSIKDYDWEVVGEYDPMWPNDYEKVVKELWEQRDREMDKKWHSEQEKKNPKKRKSWFGEGEEFPLEQRQQSDEEKESSPPSSSAVEQRTGGAAIAPPPSLQESGPASPPHLEPMVQMEKPIAPVGGYGASSVAAKIMAKYGFKEGQGLGKKEQGMSMALQVEKTSKRGGRIIHEKDGGSMPPPPSFLGSPRPGSPGLMNEPAPMPAPQKPEPTITEIMKSPSKVVLLRNMVGPGDVDDELEPEVKEECNTKYGDVIKVVIFEIPGAPSEEAVRIFVEFKRIESAIKAVVDLNGRFFGGRQVKAGFFSVEKFANLDLLDVN